MSTTSRSYRFVSFVGSVLAFNVLVILWGAVVRATGSGAGCGDHWPLCNGHVIPPEPALATLIEFIHRLTSGLALVLVLILWVGARRIFPAGHLARRSAALSLGLIAIESLIGAFIVVQSLTGLNDSALRALVIALHQANTLLLLGAITLTAWAAAQPYHLVGAQAPDGHPRPLRAPLRAPRRAAIVVGVVGLITLGATGAITALGDTLFPAASLEAGWKVKFSPTAHFLEQLRIVHPLAAGLMGIYVLMIAWMTTRHARDALTAWLALTLTGLFFAQCALGLVNVLTLAPVWIQLAHLLLADAVWICFVLLAANALRPGYALSTRFSRA